MTDVLARIDRALDADDTAAAAALAEAALAAGRTDPILYNLVAWRREEDGQFEEAERLLRDAVRLAPADPTIHLALGIVLRKQGQLKAAVQAFERAIAIDQTYGAAWFERGSTFEKGGASADAADDYLRALQYEPNNAAAHASLAAIMARRGDLAEARQRAGHALKLDPGNITARNALAQLAIEERDFTGAIALLEPIVGTEDDQRELLINTRTLLGDAYEGAGRHDDAYRCYLRAQTLFHAIHSAREGEDARDPIAFVEGVAESLHRADPKAWATSIATASAVEAGPAAAHVFLTGYPRSGTTLVENILATLPATVAIEERPTLSEVDRRFLSDTDGLQKLASLPEAELDALRADYWRRANLAAGTELAGKMLVDMDPFKGVRLPVIARLFPHAKVIVMRRDPRDVVWSCFHTNFAYNAGTMAFSSLESTARHYAATWGVIETSLETLAIKHFNLSYSALVRDFDATTQALCAYLGAEWSEDLRRFDRTAQRRGVSTASATQVRRGLYDGSGGWHRYEKQLATVEPILAPWIERFEIGT
ncbi:tetratricopeptide repeat-containing sulfotransferase family protein [Novosphingobium lentum]|uniref:tetratricopeptide repeat-containing sulfotransferase family protein n=1 Tax=Novosphingobium lentum TaxID=145287 RepID=UPI000830B7AA|nr:sulfotransferase [Novosphingobium lentum]